MKTKIILSLLFGLSAVFSAQAQLLYRISGNGLGKDSYIVGTYHIAEAGYIDKITGAREALDQVEQVCGELVMSDAGNPDSVAFLQQKMMLEDGKTIKDILTAEQFGKLDKYFEGIVGMPLSNPQIFPAMGNLNPAALSTQLTLLNAVKKGHFNMASEKIDDHFQQLALQTGKAVKGLETIAFQAEVLFFTPLDRQIEQIMCMVENSAYFDSMTDRMDALYYAQDVEKMYELMQEKTQNECDSKPEDLDVLLHNRNDNWAKQMPAMMKEHPTFFVVGAGHLGGPRGVLAQLKGQGYTVEGVR